MVSTLIFIFFKTVVTFLFSKYKNLVMKLLVKTDPKRHTQGARGGNPRVHGSNKEQTRAGVHSVRQTPHAGSEKEQTYAGVHSEQKEANPRRSSKPTQGFTLNKREQTHAGVHSERLTPHAGSKKEQTHAGVHSKGSICILEKKYGNL